MHRHATRHDPLVRLLATLMALVVGCIAIADDDVGACVDIDDPQARLACYDIAVKRRTVAHAKDEGDALEAASNVAAMPNTVATPKPAPTSPPHFSEPPPKTEVSEQSTVVARVAKRARGQHVVHLENGEIWQENFASSYFPVEPGDEVVIKKRRFGGYRLVAPSGKGFRVERVR